jgi:hypothetical protein
MEHLAEHGGNFRNPTSGSPLDRTLGGAGMLAFVTTFDAKMRKFSVGSPIVSNPDS